MSSIKLEVTYNTEEELTEFELRDRLTMILDKTVSTNISFGADGARHTSYEWNLSISPGVKKESKAENNGVTLDLSWEDNA